MRAAVRFEKFQTKKPAASFPGAGSIVAMMDIRRWFARRVKCFSEAPVAPRLRTRTPRLKKPAAFFGAAG